MLPILYLLVIFTNYISIRSHCFRLNCDGIMDAPLPLVSALPDISPFALPSTCWHILLLNKKAHFLCARSK